MTWTLRDALESCALVVERPALGRDWVAYAHKAAARGYDRATQVRYANACLHRQLGRERSGRKRSARGFSAWKAPAGSNQPGLFDDSDEQGEIRRAGAPAKSDPP